LATCQQRVFGVVETKRVLQFSSMSFDASVSEIFMTLRNGGTLCLARQETLASAPDLVKLMREQGITTVTLPPSMLAVMPTEELPALETIIAAGEACPRELVMRWAPGRQFFNAYGPTETTVCATIALCDENDPRPPSIGRPIANTQLYIVDVSLQPVPIGVPGELCVGGVGLAQGYLNRPEMTGSRFILNPFSEEPGARLYRTGDLVRYRTDGDIEFLGRIDQQVKLRGFRIELGEVEATLSQHPSVQEAIVIVREDVPGDKRLVAYLTRKHDAPSSNQDLRRYLKERLPEYMIPSAFVVLERFPQTPNGKVDRRALPVPDRTAFEAHASFVAPRTPLEEALVSIWVEVLRVPRISVHDNFFELGGHSLLATQVVSQIRRKLQVELPLPTLFEKNTVADLALRITQSLAEQAHSDEIESLLSELEDH
jgi:acyl-coenzyme A synthetase/AMP-(fatty) acid ligase/acyl carrier protein